MALDQREPTQISETRALDYALTCLYPLRPQFSLPNEFVFSTLTFAIESVLGSCPPIEEVISDHCPPVFVLSLALYTPARSLPVTIVLRSRQSVASWLTLSGPRGLGLSQLPTLTERCPRARPGQTEMPLGGIVCSHLTFVAAKGGRRGSGAVEDEEGRNEEI
ncbi:hypothetical protein RRG08_038682 [Elysia crispata]|uniref:Uncharacterized protein n=1 Tax=Elysia crispata TaxID=231223 RepID=A0AAE0ZK05_9GAST|nr:hypothetical protein RRG08_038682 [Elysia crispata]